MIAVGPIAFIETNGEMNEYPPSHMPAMTPTIFTGRDPDSDAVAIQIPPKI